MTAVMGPGAGDPTAPLLVLPLVVRIERSAPPTRTDALEAAARAVLVLLSDPASSGDGEWAAAVHTWESSGRIRKVVRRARGAAWERAGALPGRTVTAGTAQVRVFPPVPLDAWPPDLAKLQVGGTELDEPAPPAAPDPAWPVLWMNPDLPMTAGKQMAQAGHAAQLAWWASDPAVRRRWREAAFPLAVRAAPRERWAALLVSGLPVVTDGGFTEVEPGSRTVIADVPWLRTAMAPPG